MNGWEVLGLALGWVMIFEGITPLIAPARWRRMIEELSRAPDSALRGRCGRDCRDRARHRLDLPRERSVTLMIGQSAHGACVAAEVRRLRRSRFHRESSRAHVCAIVTIALRGTLLPAFSSVSGIRLARATGFRPFFPPPRVPIKPDQEFL